METAPFATITLGIDPQLQWLWSSSQDRSFIVGDERVAFALPYSDPAALVRLNPARPYDPSAIFHHPCNLPIPESLYQEFADRPWCGFHFLGSTEYDRALDAEGHPVGDLLRTIVFGPDYGHYVLHRPTEQLFGLSVRSLRMMRRTEAGFRQQAEVRMRGRRALIFAAHPHDALIAHGGDDGTFYAHLFSETGFGRARRIVAKDRRPSALTFIDDGRGLLLGGMGCLSHHVQSPKGFIQTSELASAVRGIHWMEDRRTVVVNQGTNGVAFYRLDEERFTKVDQLHPKTAVHQMAVSPCGRYIATTGQSAPEVTVFEVTT